MITIGLCNKTRTKIIEEVIGQLYNGMWKNSPEMRKYWKYCYTQGTYLIIDNDKLNSGFNNKTEDWIRHWFAGKLKAVVQSEITQKYGWSRCNIEIAQFISHNTNITVSHCYECYDYLLCSTGHTYSFQALTNTTGMKEYRMIISKSIRTNCTNLNIDIESSSFNDWVNSVLDYYEQEFILLTNQGFDENYFNELNQNISSNEKYALVWPTYNVASKMLKSMFYNNSDYLKMVTEQYSTSMAADECFKAIYFITLRVKMLQDIYKYFKTR